MKRVTWAEARRLALEALDRAERVRREGRERQWAREAALEDDPDPLQQSEMCAAVYRQFAEEHGIKKP